MTDREKTANAVRKAGEIMKAAGITNFLIALETIDTNHHNIFLEGNGLRILRASAYTTHYLIREVLRPIAPKEPLIENYERPLATLINSINDEIKAFEEQDEEED